VQHWRKQAPAAGAVLGLKNGASVKERKFSRIPVGTRAVFSWGQEGEPKQGKGVTRDISAGGTYLYTKTPPPVGTPVKLDLILPRVRGAMKALRMKVLGRVVRVHPLEDPDEQISGFAAITDTFVLREPREQQKESTRQSDRQRW
jgi:hypothetical protein